MGVYRLTTQGYIIKSCFSVSRAFNIMDFRILATCILLCHLIVSGLAASDKVGQPLLCDGCLAILKELHKKLKDSQGRKRLITASLKNLCDLNNFTVYRFSPPKMIKACNYIVETYRKELEESLIAYYKKYRTEKNLLLQEEFCDRKLKACEGMQKPPEEGLGLHPEGMDVDQANEKLKNIVQEKELTIEKPVDFTTPMPKEEL